MSGVERGDGPSFLRRFPKSDTLHQSSEAAAGLHFNKNGIHQKFQLSIYLIQLKGFSSVYSAPSTQHFFSFTHATHL